VAEEALNKMGLSCRGEPQLEGCFAEDASALSDEKRDHCERFMVAQSMQGVAVAGLLMAALAVAAANRESATPRSRAGLRVVGTAAGALAAYSASAVLDLVAQSYMFAGERELDYECQDMFGMQLCHGPGPSFRFQGWASVVVLEALVLCLLAACVERQRTQSVVERAAGDVLVLSLDAAAAAAVPSADARVPLLQPRDGSESVVDAVAVPVAREEEGP